MRRQYLYLKDEAGAVRDVSKFQHHDEVFPWRFPAASFAGVQVRTRPSLPAAHACAHRGVVWCGVRIVLWCGVRICTRARVAARRATATDHDARGHTRTARHNWCQHQ